MHPGQVVSSWYGRALLIMEMSLLLLCLITILEIVLFQQVYVNLIMDIVRLQNCAHTSDDNCDLVGCI